jgi:predicted molibdopterin-dependent oxidoreductase YjgC
MAKRIENTGEPVQFTFDGQTVTAQSGDTVAAALTAAGIDILRSSVVSGAPRGVFCMMGTCFDCLVEVDGVANRQACQIPVTEGLTVCSQQGAPDVLEASA